MSMATENRINFWRRNAKVPGSIQPVYGAQHPPLDPRLRRTFPKDTPKPVNSLKSKKASSFHEFTRSTNDAWDIDDEEDESFLCPVVHPSSLPTGLHPSTHSQPPRPQPQTAWHPETGLSDRPGLPQGQPGPREIQQQQQQQEEEQEECGPINGKVVKSSSEAHLNISAVQRGYVEKPSHEGNH